MAVTGTLASTWTADSGDQPAMTTETASRSTDGAALLSSELR